MVYDPTKESLRSFNSRFNTKLDASSIAIDASIIIQIYMRVLMRGDPSFTKDVVMSRDLKSYKML